MTRRPGAPLSVRAHATPPPRRSRRARLRSPGRRRPARHPANPGFDGSDPTRAPVRDPRTLAPQDGFANFLRVLREETIAFRRPVALVHGDSHYGRIDKPLLDAQGRRLENFTRVETPGDNAQTGNNDVHWVKADIDSGSREVFSFSLEVVPGNRVAVPAP